MLIDTHAHINFKDYRDDYEEVIKRALAQKIWIINVGADYESSGRAINMMDYADYEEGLYAAVGLHPGDVLNEDFDVEKYEKLIVDKKVVAIGETGLDYYHITRNAEYGAKKVSELKEKQEEIFIKHIDLARRVNRPLIIHCRDASADLSQDSSRQAHQRLISILRKALNQEKGVIHCFTGNLEQAKHYIDMGLLIGFTGIITFSHAYDEIIKKLPMDKILIETDCPFLSPAPFRGKRNEPAYVKYVAEKIAEIKDVSFEEIAEQTTANARKLFGI